MFTTIFVEKSLLSFPAASSPRWPAMTPEAAIATLLCEPNSRFGKRHDGGKTLSMQGLLAEFRPPQAWRLQQVGAQPAVPAAHRHAERAEHPPAHPDLWDVLCHNTATLLAVAKPVFPKFLAEVMLRHKKWNTSWLWTFDNKSLLSLAVLMLK